MPTIDMSGCECCGGGTPCGICAWEWNGASWDGPLAGACFECPNVTVPPDPACEGKCCVEPNYAGTFVGETANTNCQAPP